MRFVVAEPGPHFSVMDVYSGWCEGLRNAGQHVAGFNLGDRLTFYATAMKQVEEGKFARYLQPSQAIDRAVSGLYESMMKNRPHVLLVISAFFTPPELFHFVRAAGVKVIVVHTESPYEDERQLALAPHADLNLVNDPVSLEEFRAVSRAEYFPHAYRPSVHHPGDPVPELACDLAFVGTGFPSRIDFLEAMDLDGISVRLGGNWKLLDEDSPLQPMVVNPLEECLDNEDAVSLYRSARVGMNLYRREHKANDHAEGWALGPREVEMAAVGLPFLRDSRPEGDELFGGILPTFSDPAEASDLLRWWLAHPGIREAAAQKIQAVVADRSFDHHAARLLRLLDKE